MPSVRPIPTDVSPLASAAYNAENEPSSRTTRSIEDARGGSTIRSATLEDQKNQSWGSYLYQNCIMAPINMVKWVLFALLYCITCGHINLNDTSSNSNASSTETPEGQETPTNGSASPISVAPGAPSAISPTPTDGISSTAADSGASRTSSQDQPPIVITTQEQRQTITEESLQTFIADEMRYRQSLTGRNPLTAQEIQDIYSRAIQRSEYILAQNNAGRRTDPVLQERILAFTDRIAETAAQS